MNSYVFGSKDFKFKYMYIDTGFHRDMLPLPIYEKLKTVTSLLFFLKATSAWINLGPFSFFLEGSPRSRQTYSS